MRIHYLLVLPSSVLLPLWFWWVIARLPGINDDLGLGLMTLFSVTALFFGQIIYFILLRTRPDVRLSRTVGSLDAVLLTALYCGLLLLPATIFGTSPSGAETSSLLMKIFGDGVRDISASLGMILWLTMPLYYLVCLAILVWERFSKTSVEINLPDRLI